MGVVRGSLSNSVKFVRLELELPMPTPLLCGLCHCSTSDSSQETSQMLQYPRDCDACLLVTWVLVLALCLSV